MKLHKRPTTFCAILASTLVITSPVWADTPEAAAPNQAVQDASSGPVAPSAAPAATRLQAPQPDSVAGSFRATIDEPTVRNALLRATGAQPETVRPSLVPGFAEVLLGGQILYITNDGRFIINGDMFDTERSVNVSELLRAESRKTLINEEMAKGRAITFPAKGETKHRLAVFTDIDCGYCRELHKHIDEFNALGIEINYYMMPRSGVGTPSYFKAMNAVCAKDPQKALTLLKQGEKVEDIRCDDTRVIDSLQLAYKLGIRGTPGAVTMEGMLIPGYRQPQEFLQILEEIKANSTSANPSAK